MFKRREKKEKQEEFWVEATRLPAATPGTFYRKVNETLDAMGFAQDVWQICEPAYADAALGGRPGIDPVVYLKMLMIGFFEDLPSERAIASRCADSLSVRGFLGYGLAETARARIEDERNASAETLSPRRTQLDTNRTSLNQEWKVFGELKPPAEIAETEAKMRKADQRQRDEVTQQERLRSELALAKERLKTDREKLERDAVAERARIEEVIAQLEIERGATDGDLGAFDASLARFFQTEAPESWPNAAKTLNRETLFTNATTLGAQKTPSLGVWGVELSTDALPEPGAAYDRDQLAVRLRDVGKKLAEEKDALQAAQTRFISEFDTFEKRASQTKSALESEIATRDESRIKARDDGVRWENALVNLQSQFATKKERRRDDLAKQEAVWTEANSLLQKEAAEMEAGFRARAKNLDNEFKERKAAMARELGEQQTAISHEETQAAHSRDEEVARIERESRDRLTAEGADAVQLAAAQKRASDAEREIERISRFRDEVAEYRKKKSEWIDRLPSWDSEINARDESLRGQQSALQQASERHRVAIDAFNNRRRDLDEALADVQEDEKAVDRFRKDPRFNPETGYFERDDLPAAAFHKSGAARGFLEAAEWAHQSREDIGTRGGKAAKAFLNRFDPETLDRKVLGFSPIHEFFDWSVFVGIHPPASRSYRFLRVTPIGNRRCSCPSRKTLAVDLRRRGLSSGWRNSFGGNLNPLDPDT